MKKLLATFSLLLVLGYVGSAFGQVPNIGQPGVPNAGSSGGGGGPSGSSSMQVFNVTGAAGNGTTDDQGPINAALTSCGNAGGGWVVLSNGRYLVDTVGLTVPSRCIVYCPVPLLGNANPTNYSSVPYGVILNSAQTITMSKNSGWQGCPVLQKAVVNSTAWADYPTLTQRDTLNLLGTFAGNAFTITGSSDVQIRDTFIGGFALGINASVTSTARLQMDHVNIDATKCMLLDNSHDISRLSHVECFPFVTSGQAAAQTSFAISNIANNGTGLYRVTLTTPSAIPVTGDTVWINQSVVGPQSVQARRWVITVIDTTHFDLQSSPGTGSFTATGNVNTLATTICGLSSTASIGVGQGISGTGIPGSTTVTFIAQGGCLGISNAATATNAGLTLTFTDTAYSSGGSASLDAAFRTGIGFEFTNSEGIIGQDLFAFGHQNAFHAGTGMSWFSCSSCFSDGPINPDLTVVGLLIDGTAKGATFNGGRLNNTAVQLNSSSGFVAANINGVQMDTNSSNWTPVIEMDQGSGTFNGNSSSNGTGFYLVQDAISTATFVGNSLSGRFAFQTIAGENKVNAIANNILAANFGGVVQARNQQWIIGGGGANCVNSQGNTCSIQLGGPQVDLASQTQAMTNAGSLSISGNAHLIVLTAGSGITGYTLNLPGVSTAGQWLKIYIQQTITGLTMGGTTSTGMPTNPTAGWYDCFSTSTSAYVCGSG